MTAGIRLNMIVEGPSEEKFVRSVLAPYLGTKNVFAIARSVETSRHRVRQTNLAGRDYVRIYRGGLTGYEKAKPDIERWLKQDLDAYVTTMFDYYALPEDFPGMALLPHSGGPYEKGKALEQAFAEDVNNPRFVPY